MNILTKPIAAILTVAAIFLATASNAQTKKPVTDDVIPDERWDLSVGAELGKTTGDLTSLSSLDAGGSLRLFYNTHGRLSFILTGGFYNAFGTQFTTVNTSFPQSSFHVVPVEIGFRIIVYKHYYILFEGGQAYELNYDQNTKTILSPGIGWTKKHLDVGFHYDFLNGQTNNYGFANLRIAYSFKL